MSQALDIDAAHFAGEAHVDAVDDANRLGGDEVSANDADACARHGRIGDAQGKQRFDTAPCVAHALEHAVHRLGVGDAQAAVIATRDVLLLENCLDLRAGPVHDHQPRAKAVEKIEVMHDA